MKTTIELIEQTICSYFDLTPYQLFRNTRKKEIITPRHLFFYLSYKFTNKSLAAIGRYPEEENISKKSWDHASVLHSRNKIRNFISVNDKQTLKHVWELEKKLKLQKVYRTKILINNFNLLKMAENYTKSFVG